MNLSHAPSDFFGGIAGGERFTPTPERVSQYLERNVNEVAAQMCSVDGRQQLYRELLQHKRDLRRAYPGFQSHDLQRQLELIGETLSKKDRYLRTVRSPERRSLWSKVWGGITYLPRKHPVITSVLLAAGAGWGIAKLFGLLGAAIPVPDTAAGRDAVAQELVPPAAPTDNKAFGAISPAVSDENAAPGAGIGM
jgi:hypothetical protein